MNFICLIIKNCFFINLFFYLILEEFKNFYQKELIKNDNLKNKILKKYIISKKMKIFQINKKNKNNKKQLFFLTFNNFFSFFL